jgi:hypothetical protein
VLDEPLVEFRDDHIYVRHAAGLEITPETIDGLWGFLSEQCARFDCSSILIEADAPKRSLDTVSAFTSGVDVSRIAPNLWLALCFHDYEPDELSELFRRAAYNRGANVDFFSECEAALAWLRANNPRF